MIRYFFPSLQRRFVIEELVATISLLKFGV
jgi:hypothetical protein